MKPKYVTPSLESITLRGKYRIQAKSFTRIEKMLKKVFNHPDWGMTRVGKSLAIMRYGPKFQIYMRKVRGDPKFIGALLGGAVTQDLDKKLTEVHLEQLKSLRPGCPIHILLTEIEHFQDSSLVEIECRPVMWYQVSQLNINRFTENQIQEAQIECKNQVKQVMSAIAGKEIEPVSVYPIIPRTEIKSRLLNLGLKEVVDSLDTAERHIAEDNYTDSLKCDRTAFEKAIDYQMKRRALEHTDSYTHDLERLRSKGILDPDTTELIEKHYHLLSNVGVHEKGAKPGFYEAEMGFGMTLIILDYFANKLP